MVTIICTTGIACSGKTTITNLIKRQIELTYADHDYPMDTSDAVTRECFVDVIDTSSTAKKILETITGIKDTESTKNECYRNALVKIIQVQEMYDFRFIETVRHIFDILERVMYFNSVTNVGKDVFIFINVREASVISRFFFFADVMQWRFVALNITSKSADSGSDTAVDSTNIDYHKNLINRRIPDNCIIDIENPYLGKDAMSSKMAERISEIIEDVTAKIVSLPAVSDWNALYCDDISRA